MTELLVADVAFERLLSGVDVPVLFQVVLQLERFRTLVALEDALLRRRTHHVTSGHVSLPLSGRREHLVTRRTDE